MGLTISGGGSASIPDSSVTSVKLADSSVTSAKIADGAIVNADVNASAAIAYSKLNLGTSIVNADVNASAAIAYSKLALTGAVVNADVNASAAIAYSKLNLGTSIVNADINASAAIAESKLAGGAGLGAYRTLQRSNGRLTTAATTSTKYYLVPGNNNISSVTEPTFTNAGIFLGLTAADLAVTGKTTKLRLEILLVAGTAPAVTITAGLYPLSNASGTYTLGTVVSGSTVPFASPGGLAMTSANSGDFDIPADGFYGVGYIVSGTPSGNVSLYSNLQLRYV